MRYDYALGLMAALLAAIFAIIAYAANDEARWAEACRKAGGNPNTAEDWRECLKVKKP